MMWLRAIAWDAAAIIPPPKYRRRSEDVQQICKHGPCAELRRREAACGGAAIMTSRPNAEEEGDGAGKSTTRGIVSSKILQDNRQSLPVDGKLVG
ncbi:hypothetical protein E2C01_007484 [Portunus trituberculatus]|uniref:Uncharacterized protein n=1 Tax=Portunus trituberculatus TaxID=210409 RepID=A0A5B7D4C6_PORTR|nr:hypothetical protein [Portunus trituberculatus]